jgi:peptidoglycan/LPS O-acetylase OafA/YrhL
MGRRSRKRRDPLAPPRAERPARVRGEARDEQIRASLEPVEPGERPQAVTIAAVVAALLGVGNLVMLAAGVQVQDKDAPVGGTVLFALLMFGAAAGMWRAKYWAVLGFQALLGLTLVIAGGSILVASDAAAVALCAAILIFGGWLFWKLIRALARLQMPERRASTGDV